MPEKRKTSRRNRPPGGPDLGEIIGARGLRWGQLVAGLEAMRMNLSLVTRGVDLINAFDRRALQNLDDVLTALEQRVWAKKGWIK